MSEYLSKAKVEKCFLKLEARLLETAKDLRGHFTAQFYKDRAKEISTMREELLSGEFAPEPVKKVWTVRAIVDDYLSDIECDNNKDIEDIVRDFLEVQEYDGLYGEECGCDLKILMACGNPNANECRAGYKSLPGEDEYEDGNHPEFDYYIGDKENPEVSP